MGFGVFRVQSFGFRVFRGVGFQNSTPWRVCICGVQISGENATYFAVSGLRVSAFLVLGFRF